MFYPVLIARTLQENRAFFSSDDQSAIDEVVTAVIQRLPSYQNASGRLTYNFWPTDSTFVFHYNGSTKEKRKLPDDLDDTALALLVSKASKTQADSAHAVMQGYTNRPGKRVRGAPRAYRKFQTYSTWYGKRFPVVFDVSVLLNVLDFVYHYDLPLTSADSAAIHLIAEMLERKDHLRKPKTLSPYYPQSSLILYHLARVIDRHDPAFLRDTKADLVAQGKQLMDKSEDVLERCILRLTLAKLGVESTLGEEAFTIESIRSSEFSFFHGNAPSYFPNIIRKPLDWLNLLEYKHYSEGHNLSILLEYLILYEQGSPAKLKP